MKDCTYENLGRNSDGSVARPSVSAVDAIEFCLQQFGRDRTKRFSDEMVKCLTYEEVIGALLLGLDAAKQVEEIEERESEYDGHMENISIPGMSE